MSKITVTKSSGNVFADIGVPNPKEHALKAALVTRIARSIAAQELTQDEAAKRMRLSQPDVSKLLRGQFRPFSIERLMRLLTSLGQDVTIAVVEPARPRRVGKLAVADA